jgi:hypothetical protein
VAKIETTWKCDACDSLSISKGDDLPDGWLSLTAITSEPTISTWTVCDDNVCVGVIVAKVRRAQ